MRVGCSSVRVLACGSSLGQDRIEAQLKRIGDLLEGEIKKLSMDEQKDTLPSEDSDQERRDLPHTMPTDQWHRPKV